MNWRLRKARPLEELARDSELMYHVGQLQGAMVMASAALSTLEGPLAKIVAERLDETSAWFFTTNEVKA